MKFVRKLLLTVAFGAVILSGLAACSSTSQDPNAVGTEPVSTLPWNRPQNWEGKGVVGGMMGGN
ncbi:MAG: hypothetical protein LBD30_05555 [Verrucomicrobiales bacterium]|jgi:hypothetical protein|nr:hypothetical protein [Verrucomicrobiales bacterium]